MSPRTIDVQIVATYLDALDAVEKYTHDRARQASHERSSLADHFQEMSQLQKAASDALEKLRDATQGATPSE